MIKKQLCQYSFLLILFTVFSQIQPSMLGNKKDNNDVKYLLDSIPISINKNFTNMLHEIPNFLSKDKFHVEIEPKILDFNERQLGIPHQKTVTLFNKNYNQTIHLFSISGNTQYFYASFFQEKMIPPLGNTSFNVIFLGRNEGKIETYFFIYTSNETLKYQVKGIGVRNPYRLHPVIDVKLPINASFTQLIYVHNPHSEIIQVVEIYNSGREFHLELPTGELEGSHDLWKIPPYQTKPVIRLNFNAFNEKNHTTYIGFRFNNSSEILIVVVEIEIITAASLHSGGDSEIVNFGMEGSQQSPIYYKIAFKNSVKRPVTVRSIASTPMSKALKINFEPTIISKYTQIPIIVGMLIYGWKAGLDLKHFKGELIIKSIEPNNFSQKIVITWVAKVLQSGHEVNSPSAYYYTLHSNLSKNFSMVNKFKLPLAITNILLPFEVIPFFNINNFITKILKSGQRDHLFTLSSIQNRKYKHLHLQSIILIHSNVSIIKIPLLIYNGKLQKIIRGEEKNDKGTINFGSVSSGTEHEDIFAVKNNNPIDVKLHNWGMKMPGAVLELIGCQNISADFFNNCIQNITACCVARNQTLKPNNFAIFKIKIKTPHVEENTLEGDVFIRMTYEKLIIPVYMKVVHGKISMKKLTFRNYFLGSICLQSIVYSTFTRSMKVKFITLLYAYERIKYIPIESNSYPIITKGNNNIGSIVIYTTITFKENCYLGLILNIGIQWLNTLSLPSDTCDSDLELLNTHYKRYLNITNDSSWENITLQLDTSEVHRHKLILNVKNIWPSLLIGLDNVKNKNLVVFPLTQVGNISYRNITLYNPTLNPLLIHLVMDWSYPQGLRLFHALLNKFKPICLECLIIVHGEFKLQNNLNEKYFFEHWGITSTPNSIPKVLEPNKTKTIQLSYTPSSPSLSSALLYIRNLTIFEALRLKSRGAYAKFKFDNHKPGSTTPLFFELTESHFKECEIKQSHKASSPNLTVKRSFTARNAGKLAVNVLAFYINGLACEGYGFKVLNCKSFVLQPNNTRKIEIAFTPDFTLSRIERNLFIQTNIGVKIDSDISKRGIVQLSLLTTVPFHKLEACAMSIVRPHWENAIQWVAIGFSIMLFACILAGAFLDADRILRGTLVNFSRSNTTQSRLDLRLLSNSPSMQHHYLHPIYQNHHYHGKQKVSGHDNNKLVGNNLGKKDDMSPDWSILNVKRTKEKEIHVSMKIPHWTTEEERRFRIDTESKHTSSYKRCIPVESLSFENINCSKKRNTRHYNTHDIGAECMIVTSNINVSDIQVTSKKSSLMIKSSPIMNRKRKSYVMSKEVTKFIDHEIQIDVNNMFTNSIVKVSNKNNGGKQKQLITNSIHNQNTVRNMNQRVIQYSEEETSSTTTESSLQEDNNLYRNCDKVDTEQRKSSTKKSKIQNIAPILSLDYKDNYEGDCDDDDYDKEKQDNPNKWKVSTTRSGSKHHLSRLNTESLYRHPRQKQNLPRKEKILQKRRSSEKSQLKVTGNNFQKEEIKPIQTTIFSIPPPPAVCWDENRAKFSDVVARNQENNLLFSKYKNNKIQKVNKYSVCESYGIKCMEVKKAQPIQNVTSDNYKFNVKSTCTINDKEAVFTNSNTFIQTNSHLNSYFINTYNEPLSKAEFMPYGDLPEVNESLIKLENIESSHSKFWHDSNSILNIISKNTLIELDASKSIEKISNLPDSLKDNWLTVETNWEPLYTRGAVGEERSGVWGINRGGVWAAAPWGASIASLPSYSTFSQPKDSNIQESSNFDPFQSLNTIWTPSSADIWTSK